MSSIDEAIFASNRAGAAFVLTDLNLAMTFLDVAETSKRAETVSRNRQNARIAYDSVRRLLPRLALTAEEWQNIQEKLSNVKFRLEAAE
jgi:hypothetical protein